MVDSDVISQRLALLKRAFNIPSYTTATSTRTTVSPLESMSEAMHCTQYLNALLGTLEQDMRRRPIGSVNDDLRDVTKNVRRNRG